MALGGGGNYKWLISMLLFMLVLTILSIVSGGSFSSINVDQTYGAVVNGTTSEYTVAGTTFSISALEGAIGWLILIAAVGVIAGIMILGSGLGTASVKLLYKAMFYGIVWGLVSLFPSGLMFSIPLFGGLFYISLTIVYTVTVLMVI